jgi:uncharacterized protein YbcV (DUF1398 family)
LYPSITSILFSGSKTAARKAGVIAYWAFLTGRKVIYFGRKGESHVEDFPGAKS